MTPSRDFLFELVRNGAQGRRPEMPFGSLGAEDAAEVFVNGLYLVKAVRALIEQNWLSQPRGGTGLDSSVMLRGRTQDFASLATIEPLWDLDSSQALKNLERTALRLLEEIPRTVLAKEEGFFREFLRISVRRMADFCLRSAEDSEDWSSTALYRAFEMMDEVLGLQSEQESLMEREPENRERVYEAAGAGVQTSYSSILRTLEGLDLPQGACVIDLGSGFGRMGLMAGLWRKDLKFIGYEYVSHRVEAAETSAMKAGLSDRVRFFRQDLADSDFRIPAAEAYYMYDPFCEETYRKVLRQLVEIGRTAEISVVTKADAGHWLREAVKGEKWREEAPLDEGTLCRFRSVLGA